MRVVLERGPTATILEPTLISVALVVPVYFVVDVSLMVQVSFLRFSPVKEEAETLVTVTKIVSRLSAAGWVMTSNRLVVKTP